MKPEGAAPVSNGALPREVRHRLRSDIGQVLGYAELWLDEIEDETTELDREQLREDLCRLKSAAARVLDIVNEYVDPVGSRAGSEARALSTRRGVSEDAA